MKYTLLELVQGLLSAMDSDEVNSINDTVESYQLALLFKDVYYDLATDLGLPEHESLFELNASGDNAKPTLMTLPSNVVKMNWIKYNNKTDDEDHANYQPVHFKPFHEFLEFQNGMRERDTSDAGEMVFTQNGESFDVMYDKTRMPMYYTTTNDRQVLFDAYDAEIDTTLVKSKTMCHGQLYSSFTLSDSFTPDLDPAQFAYYRNKAKMRAFSELKQVVNTEAATEARRQKIITQKNARTVPDEPEVFKVARFGRMPGGYANGIPKKLRNGM